MREGLFSAIISSEGPLVGRRFLDLYAGTGAVGIEAWSRGAAHVLTVEQDQRAARVIKQNVQAVGAGGAVVVLTSGVGRLARAGADGGPYDVVFADPPYEVPDTQVVEVLSDLHRAGWVGRAALLVVERATRREVFAWPGWVAPLRSRSYGEGTLWYGRADGEPLVGSATDTVSGSAMDDER